MSSEWTIDEKKRAQYAKLFTKLCNEAGGVEKLGKANAGLHQAGLPVDTLMAIWALADLDGDDLLNLPEYMICCFLIARCVVKGGPPPLTLPPELAASANPDAAAAEAADAEWTIDDAKRAQYTGLFHKLCGEVGFGFGDDIKLGKASAGLAQAGRSTLSWRFGRWPTSTATTTSICPST